MATSGSHSVLLPSLTTLMVTHNLRLAVQYGNRLVIMVGGRIVADISREDKDGLSEEDLLTRFRELAAAEVTDRLVGG